MRLANIVGFSFLVFNSCIAPTKYSKDYSKEKIFDCYSKPIQVEIDSFYANKNKRLYELKTLSNNCIYYESVYDSSSVSLMNTPIGWQRIYICKDSMSITPVTGK
jgi:hypothetical protein